MLDMILDLTAFSSDTPAFKGSAVQSSPIVGGVKLTRQLGNPAPQPGFEDFFPSASLTADGKPNLTAVAESKPPSQPGAETAGKKSPDPLPRQQNVVEIEAGVAEMPLIIWQGMAEMPRIAGPNWPRPGLPEATGRKTVERQTPPPALVGGAQVSPSPAAKPGGILPVGDAPVESQDAPSAPAEPVKNPVAFLTPTPPVTMDFTRPAPVLPTQIYPVSTLIMADAAPVDEGLDDAAVSRIEHVSAPATSASMPTARGQPVSSVPAQIVHQVVEAAKKADGAVEITLDPVELGRVRMTLTAYESGMNVQLMVERPETLDLLRRHIGLLETELQSQGMKNIGFEFTAQDDRGNQAFADEASDRQDQIGADEKSQKMSVVVPIASNAGVTGLDMRL